MRSYLKKGGGPGTQNMENKRSPRHCVWHWIEGNLSPVASCEVGRIQIQTPKHEGHQKQKSQTQEGKKEVIA